MGARGIIIASGTALALLAGGTAAGAVIAGGPISSGVIHGCYATKAVNGSHTLVLQDVGTACSAGDTAIKWNQKGPAGPQGPTGPAGAQGPAGAANVDRGVVSWSGGGAPGQTCTLTQVAGPDAASLTATGPQVANVCEIDGLQPGSIVTVSGFGGIGMETAGLFTLTGGSLQVWTSGSTGKFTFIAVPGS